MIDEIYELFRWDPARSTEENHSRAERGMELAAKIRYLHPFIQPILPNIGKSAWDPCAQVLAARSDDELEPHLYQLLEWIQDMNWPGAMTIYHRLLRFPYACLEPWLSLACTIARRHGDDDWLEILEGLREEAQ